MAPSAVMLDEEGLRAAIERDALGIARGIRLEREQPLRTSLSSVIMATAVVVVAATADATVAPAARPRMAMTATNNRRNCCMTEPPDIE